MTVKISSIYMLFVCCLCSCGATTTADNQVTQQINTKAANLEQSNTKKTNAATNTQKESNRQEKNNQNAKPANKNKLSCLENILDTGGKLPRVIVEGKQCLREQLPIEVLSEIEKSAKRKYVEYMLSVALQPSNPDDDKNPRFVRYYTFVGSKDETGKVYDFQNADKIENGWTFSKKGRKWIYKGRE